MRIALAQFDFPVGAVAKNAERVMRYVPIWWCFPNWR